jgi:hypothetical protein
MTASELTYIRRYLNDNSNFTDAFLSSQWVYGEQIVSQLVPCLLTRVAIDTSNGRGDYFLPDDLIGISKVTWKGFPVEATSYQKYQMWQPLNMTTGSADAFQFNAFQEDAFQVGTETGVSFTGKPLVYIFNREQFNTIRLIPAPSETLTSGGDLWGADINIKLIVQYYQRPNVSVQIPSYVRRLLLRNYTIWKAYEKEGDTQDLTIATFFQSLFNQILEVFKLVNAGCFVSRQRQLGGNSPQRSYPPSPQLPSKYWLPVRR